MANILVIDSDDNFRLELVQRLSEEGFRVTGTKGASEALKICKGQPLDVVLMDVLTPELSGGNFLKSLRETKDIPLIVMAALDDLKATKDIYHLHINSFVAKPIQYDILIQEIWRCIPKQEAQAIKNDKEFCKLSINELLAGRKVDFNIFIKISDEKYIKIAHKGDDLTKNRLLFYKEKGLQHLYILRQDFRQYVGLPAPSSESPTERTAANAEKKNNLMFHSYKTLRNDICHDGISDDVYSAAETFVEATIDLVSDDTTAVDILDSLRQNCNPVFVHTLGVSVYSVMMAQSMEWQMPTNKFKLAMGALFHDIGMKELSPQILNSPRYSWSSDDVKEFETHPMRGIALLHDMPGIPEDVLEIIKQHHENCLSHGFPMKTKRTSIHPMAKLISVADEFCYRVLPSIQTIQMDPSTALQDMQTTCAEQLDKKCFESLVKLFPAASVASGA